MVKWGMIGAGDVCERKSGPPLYLLYNSDLILVHRRNRDAGEDFVQRHGHGRYVSSFDELISSPEINAIYVASPHPLHREHTMKALEAGKHVLVEKPMSIDSKGCDSMIAAADKSGCSLGVAYYRRGYPSIRYIADKLREGIIGTPEALYFCNEFPTSHRLDLVHYFFGEIASAGIGGSTDDPFLPARRIPYIEALTHSGVTVRMAMGWLETGMPESLIIQGSKGRIYLHDLKAGQMIFQVDGQERSVHVGGLRYTHWGLIDNFNKAVEGKEELLCDGIEGRKSSVILDHLATCIDGEGMKKVSYG
ncbi:Gfo/Idh/MocA family oxidoreductase [Oceanispirochaeta sp.]|uniref:Gfo/Idh/MocA family protein n=1 Tax=Oceanispirochaeta sp. TaxID=2035350 RepID=UPI002620041B|nr:Gfo/Idh/MocA family oxidoreductase [Oceanispirochaeta sp.]MDA3955108.1 Gfo/Idh/MocA family oxidoreductase [Oceanispirochaeta sp.]